MKQLKKLLAALLLLSSTLAMAADENSYVEDARIYLQKGDIKSAVIQLKNALQQAPSDIEARLLLGKVYLQGGNGPSAEKELKRAARLNASRDRWQVELAQAYILQGKYQELLDEIEPDPTLSGKIQADVYTLRGHAHQAGKSLEQARKDYEKALAITPDNASATLGLAQITAAEGDLQQGRKIVDSLLTEHPDNFEARLFRAELLKQSKLIDSALTDYNHALKVRPNSIRALIGRAILTLQKGEYAKAQTDLNLLNERAKENPLVMYLNGVSAFQQRKLDEAEQYISQVLNLQPNHVQSQLIYGAIHYANQDYVQAEEYLSRAHAKLSRHLPTVKLLAATRIKLKKYNQAVEVLEPAVEAFPKDAQLKAMLGNTYLKNGRFDKGSELLGQAIELMPDIASLRTQRAFGLLAQGDTTSAIGELESAVDLGQDLIQADVLLVLSHLRNKEIGKALTASKALETRQPENPLARNLTGLAYLAGGDEEQARTKFREALELDPKFVTAEVNLARIELSKNRLQEAEALFRSILGKAPTNLTALLGMAGLEERGNNRAGMYEWLQQAQQKNPSSSKPGVLITQSHLRDGDNLKALRTAREAISNFPRDPAVLQVLASAQMAGGETNSAVQSYRQLVELQRTPRNMTLLATALRKAKDLPGAREILESALKANPKYLPAITTLAGIAIEQERYPEVIALARQSQSLYPKQSVGYEFEGLALLRQDQVAESLPLFEKAYQIQPSAKLALQLTRLYRAQGKKERGLEILTDWMDKSPNDVKTRALYAGLLQELDKVAEAVKEYEAVLKAQPEHLVSLNNLAWLYQKQGDPRAVETGEKAYRLGGASQPAIADTYGWVLVNFGQPDRGLALLQEAISKMPDNPEVAYHVGFALTRLQRDDEAKKILTRIVRDHADSAAGKQAASLLKRLN